MRRLPIISAIALVSSLLAAPAFAQNAPPAKPPASAKPPADPVLATVNGQPIHFSDIQSSAQNLPAQMQQMSPQQLFPLLLNQQIDRRALLVAAQSEKLQNDPTVAAAMQQAADEKLENAYVQQQIAPAITDAAVQASYKANYASKAGAEEVDAKHILVKTQAEATAIITQLNHGADFSKLAEKYSIDPGGKNGGELGWFTQDQMVPPFANAAFALKVGEYTKTPVQSQFGWHVILCEGKRTSPAPAFDDVKDQIRQTLADNAIKNTLGDARSKVNIQMVDADGNDMGPPPPGGAMAAPPGQ